MDKYLIVITKQYKNLILIILAIVSPYKPTESVPITTNVVSLNPLMTRCTQYNIYEINFVSDLYQVGCFLRVLWFSPPKKLTAAEILLKVALNT